MRPVVVVGSNHWEWQHVTSAAGQTARQRGLLLCREDPLPPLLRRLAGGPPAAVLVGNVTLAQEIRQAFPRLPIACLDLESGACAGADVDVVALDEEGIGAMAAAHLLDRGIAHFATWDIESHPFGVRRRAGFEAYLADRGIRRFHPFSLSLASSGNWKGASHHGSVRHWLWHLPKPTGVLATCDAFTEILVRESMIADRAIPESLAVVGVGDTPNCSTCARPLSSVVLPWERISQVLVEMIHEQITAGPQAPRRVVMKPLGVATRQSSDLLAIEDEDVRLALRFIFAESRTIRCVDEVVRHVSVNRKTLERKFHVFLGRSILQEIHRVKVESAKFLLGTTDQSIDWVAEQCGLGHRRNFAPAFRKFTGMTATAYRRQVQYPTNDRPGLK